MDNKNNYFILIPLILFLLSGIFLCFDNLYFHFIFKAKPGSCLILEERFCKSGKLKYKDGEIIGIVFTVSKNTPLFSPISDNYSVSSPKKKDGSAITLFTVGNQTINNSNSQGLLWYHIYFDGDVLENFSSSKLGSTIKKGTIFGIISPKLTTKNTEVTLSIKNVSLNSFNTVEIVDNKEAISHFYEKIKNKQ